MDSRRLDPVLLCLDCLGAVTEGPQRPREQKPATTNPNDAPAEPAQDDVETLKIDTNLVTVPVIASSRTGNYIADLRKEEFKLSEDGVPQEIAFLATVNAPFYVVLMLDTSDSTANNLSEIQRAAIAFLSQLGPRDKVKIISFDNELHDWNDFTGDKGILRAAIEHTGRAQVPGSMMRCKWRSTICGRFSSERPSSCSLTAWTGTATARRSRVRSTISTSRA